MPTRSGHLRHLGQKSLPRRSASSLPPPPLPRLLSGAMRRNKIRSTQTPGERAVLFPQLSFRGLYFNSPVPRISSTVRGTTTTRRRKRERESERERDPIFLRRPRSSRVSVSRLSPVQLAHTREFSRSSPPPRALHQEHKRSFVLPEKRRPSRATLLRDVTYESTAI